MTNNSFVPAPVTPKNTTVPVRVDYVIACIPTKSLEQQRRAREGIKSPHLMVSKFREILFSTRENLIYKIPHVFVPPVMP